MRAIEPDAVLGKELIDGRGTPLGEIVDVGLYTHSRVKFLVVQGAGQSVRVRNVGVEEIDNVGEAVVRLRVS